MFTVLPLDDHCRKLFVCVADGESIGQLIGCLSQLYQDSPVSLRQSSRWDVHSLAIGGSTAGSATGEAASGA